MYLDKFVSVEQRKAKEMLLVDWKPALTFSAILGLGIIIGMRLLGFIPVLGGIIGMVAMAPLYVATKDVFFKYMEGDKAFDVMAVVEAYKNEAVLKRNALVAGRVYLYIWVYSMLLIVPGVIKYYALFMTPFLAAEYKHLEPKKAMELSERMMMGHKMELFRMYIGFTPWFALGSFTWGFGYIVTWPYVEVASMLFYGRVKEEALQKGIVKASELSSVENKGGGEAGRGSDVPVTSALPAEETGE